MTVTIPLPLKELSPNARVHWGDRSKAKRKYRQWAGAAALASVRRVGWATVDTIGLKVVLYARDRRSKWDEDNLIASMKAAIDGLADAGVVTNDRGVRLERTEIVWDDPDPRVELEVTRCGEHGGG